MDCILKGMQAVHARKTVLTGGESHENNSPSEGLKAVDMKAH